MGTANLLPSLGKVAGCECLAKSNQAKWGRDRASLLQAFYTIRSERQLMERLEFDLLFRWFVGLGIDDAVWDHSVFSKNRDRLLEGEIAAKFLAAILTQPQGQAAAVDGSLLGRWHAGGSVGQHEEP